MKTFYRISNIETQQGLWYDYNGNFTGLIHDKFNFCKNSGLEMPFDEELVGYLSATDSLENLWNWFSVEDINKLEEHGYFIHVFKTDDYKWYDRFKHWVINQKNSKIVDKILLNQLVC
ncbi:MAG: hypothetical protein ACEQSQ_06115 [Candidatus Paceibacteria bacterium]